MTKTCTECGNTLWAKNRVGRCRVCQGRALGTATMADTAKKARAQAAKVAASVRPVTIHGVDYPSMKAAAAALGVYSSVISKAFLHGRVANIGVGSGNGRRA